MKKTAQKQKFSVESEDTELYSVIHLEGEIEKEGAEILKAMALTAIESGRINIVVDLERTNYIDSSVLGILISVCKRMKEVEGNLVLICPNERVMRVFEITGLDRLLHIVDTTKEAQEKIASECGASIIK